MDEDEPSIQEPVSLLGGSSTDHNGGRYATGSGTFGREVEVDIPKVPIYVNETVEDAKRYQEERVSFKSSTHSSHVFLIFFPGHAYTQEEINSPKGLGYKCYHCDRPVEEKMYFYPIRKHRTFANTFVCAPMTHCRKECAYMSVETARSNHKSKEVWSMMYPGHIHAPPERHMLGCYVKGMWTMDDFHSKVDTEISVVSTVGNDDVRMYMAPIFVAHTPYSGGQLSESAVGITDELILDDNGTMGVPRARDNSKLDIRTLKPNDMRNSKISKMFTLDKSSLS